MTNEVTTAAAEFDNHPEIGAIIITGSPKAFAADRSAISVMSAPPHPDGRTIDDAEAERSGLVPAVVPADDLLDEATAVATGISQMSLSAARMAKETITAPWRPASPKDCSTTSPSLNGPALPG